MLKQYGGEWSLLSLYVLHTKIGCDAKTVWKDCR